MSLFLFFLWFQGSSLDQAQQFYENGALLDAEGVLLTADLDPQDLDKACLLLFQISQRLGLESKQAFYESQLTHATRRPLATGFLAIASAYSKNGHGFVRFATSYLRESKSDGWLRVLLIYHLAKSSNTQFDLNALSSSEKAWFEAIRSLNQDENLPKPGPFPEHTIPFCALEHQMEFLSSDEGLSRLKSFQVALGAEDFHKTTSIINDFSPKYRRDPKIAALFFKFLASTYEKMGYPEDAKVAKQRANTARERDPLPFQKIAFTFLDEIPEPEHIAVPEPEAPHTAELEEQSFEAQTQEPLELENVNQETDPVTSGEIGRENVADPIKIEEPKEEVPSRESLQNQPASEEKPEITGSDSDQRKEKSNDLAPPKADEPIIPGEAETHFNLLETIKKQERPEITHHSEHPKDLERALFDGEQNLLETIEALPRNTAKDAIYADYLLGLFHLQGGRLVSAFKHLNQAELGVQAKPLPMIESKVLSALGEYYLREKNEDQAEWYRISATQILSESRSVPMLESTDLELNLRPFGLILDDLHLQALREDVSHSLLYFFELQTFIRARQNAYQTGCLSRNRVVSNQIKQMGQSLRSMSDNLVADAESSPRRYNQTLELWDQLWTKTEPYYQSFKAPSLLDIQRSLTLDSRCLVFIEGLDQFGAVLVSPNQSLYIPLGSQEAFNRLSSSAKLDFLNKRLGSLTQFRGQFWVVPSKNLLEADLMQGFSSQFTDANVHYIHSLAAWFWPSQTPGCLGTLVLSNAESGPIYDWVQTLPRDGLEWFISDKVSTGRVTQALASHDHLVIQGLFSSTETGLSFKLRDDQLALKELFFENPDLCTLHFMTDEPQVILDNWKDLFLLRPQGRYSISIDSESGPFQTLRLNNGLFLAPK